MSLINQVLKDLDKRGASTSIGEATIRVVHGRNQHSAFWLIAAGAAGMLVVASISWMVWQEKMKADVPSEAAVAVHPAEVLPSSQIVAAPVRALLPQVKSVSPATIVTSGVTQTITINGSNFKTDASVNLREEGGQLYANRSLITLSSEQIVLRLNFGKVTKAWTLEVLNSDGTGSGPYLFTVYAAEAKLPQVPHNIAATPKNTSSPGFMSSPVSSKPETEVKEGVIKQPTQLSSQQQADNEFRRALQLMNLGRNTEALAGYMNALKLDAGHDMARESMVNLLLEKKQNAEAERVLQEGLANNPQQTYFAMLLARLQAERNALQIALDTMLKTLPYAEKKPEYLAILAALMQRQNRHKEAIDYYRKALNIKPHTGVWLMGLGISLRAEQQNAEARGVFKNALESNTLSAELQAYVTQQLKEL